MFAKRVDFTIPRTPSIDLLSPVLPTPGVIRGPFQVNDVANLAPHRLIFAILRFRCCGATPLQNQQQVTRSPVYFSSPFPMRRSASRLAIAGATLVLRSGQPTRRPQPFAPPQVATSVASVGDHAAFPEATLPSTILAHVWSGGYVRRTLVVHPGTQQDILRQVAAKLRAQGGTEATRRAFINGRVFPFEPRRWLYLKKKAFDPDDMAVICLPDIVVATTETLTTAAAIAAVGAAMYWTYHQLPPMAVLESETQTRPGEGHTVPLTANPNERQRKGQHGKAATGLFKRETEVVNGKLEGVAKQLLVDLERQKFDPAFCLVKAKDLHVFDDVRNAPLVLIVGPKAVGKTLSMKALPSLLKQKGHCFKDAPEKALFVEIVGNDGIRVEDEVFARLRAMAPGNVPRPEGENRLNYIRDCTQGAMILLDIRRRMKTDPRDEDDRAWANDITEQIRLVWEHSRVPVVVCTSGSADILACKHEPRHRIFCFPELSWEISTLYMKKQLGLSPDANLPDWCRLAMETAPRNYPTLRRLLKRGPYTKEDLAPLLLGDVCRIDHFLIQAKCPLKPGFVQRLARHEAVPTADIMRECHGNLDAPAALTAAGILRPMPWSRFAEGQCRDLHLCQYDHFVAAMKAKLDKAGCGD